MKMIAKLIPFPATIVKRNPVAMLRWPIVSCVSPKVHATPMPIVSDIAMRVRNRR